MTSVFAKSTLHRLGIVKPDNSQLVEDLNHVRKNVDEGKTTALMIVEFHSDHTFSELVSGPLTFAEVLGNLEIVKWRAMQRMQDAES